MTKLHIDLLPKNVHIVERNLAALKTIGVFSDGKPVDYFIAPEDEYSVSNLPEQFRTNGFVVFVVGGQHFTKRLPVDRIIHICKELKAPIILLGGPEDSEVGKYVEQACLSNVLNMCGKLRFNQSVSLLKQSKVVIAHDTGLMHISGAFNKPVISIWGATSPSKFGVAPYLNTHQFVAQVEGLLCNPCSNFGGAKCPRGHFKCMKQQDVKKISEVGQAMFEHNF